MDGNHDSSRNTNTNGGRGGGGGGGGFSNSVEFAATESINHLKLNIEDPTKSTSTSSSSSYALNNRITEAQADDNHGSNIGVNITSFSQVVDDVTLYFQIIRLPKQIYAWIGCNSAKFGDLYAAAPTRPSNAVSVTSLIGGSSDNTGSGIACRVVLKTGLNVVLACNIPKNSPMLEAAAEKKLVQKLVDLGYTRPKSGGSPAIKGS